MAKKAKEPVIYSKSTLVDAVAERSGITKKDTTAVVNALIEFTKETVGEGNTIRLIGFGSFQKKHREARKGRNPQTGEDLTIAASDSLGFKSSVKY